MKRYCFPVTAAVLLLSALAGRTTIARGLQESSCLDCHDTVLPETSVHSLLECGDCHSNIEEVPHQESPLEELSGIQLCGQCHPSSAEALEKSVHGDTLDCQGCHGDAHAVTSVEDLTSAVSPKGQIQLCGDCHDDGQLVGGYSSSVHGRALLGAGLITAPSCASCHGSHTILPSSDPRSTVSLKEVPQTCGTCHRYLLDTWTQQSAHGQVWQRGEEGPVCTTCHGFHQIRTPHGPTQRLKSPQLCGDCHGARYTSYRDSFHGQVTDLGFLTAATCADCHTAHKNLPAEDPRSTVNTSHLQQTCGLCHDRVNADFVTFDPHADTENNPKLHSISVSMTLLLISVFGFFGLHDFLWLQRSMVAFFRGELRGTRNRNGLYIRRFAKVDTWLHIAVLGSFLVLAATGLPLKYHFAGWAKTLSQALGGAAFTRLLHRLAASVTFGYAAFHLAHLFKRILLGKEYSLLWGWHSIIPQPQDFRDLYRHIRYFLYVGARPRLGRWTYWEKFDYFAVFWGIIIIGLSGLILWFPAFFTRFLPGWTLNAAYVVHSDEALLAVGFIFVFHFFHTHLRPQSFPLDPVIFTGRMPLSRFREERAAEYERLVRNGDLQRYLVDPPSAKAVRRASILGFTAVAIGSLLIVAILLTFVLY